MVAWQARKPAMAGLVPAIHIVNFRRKTWMPLT
jgi:hypothetical protein